LCKPDLNAVKILDYNGKNNLFNLNYFYLIGKQDDSQQGRLPGTTLANIYDDDVVR